MMYEHSQMQDLKRHPIRGGLWGLLLGLGAALFLVGQKIIAFGTLPPILVAGGGIVLGILWSLFAPAKEPAGGPPIPNRDAYTAPDVRLEEDQWGSYSETPQGDYGAPAGDYSTTPTEYIPSATPPPPPPYDPGPPPPPPPPSQ